MAWNAYTVGSPENIEQRVRDLEPTGEDHSPELDRQMKAAKKAALAIIKAGAIGEGEAYQVGISGHANTEHVAAGRSDPEPRQRDRTSDADAHRGPSRLRLAYLPELPTEVVNV